MTYLEQHTTYKSGVQQQHKLQVITYLGWNLGKRRFDEKNIVNQISPAMIPKGTSGTLWYTMYGQQKELPLPFISEKKKIIQTKHFAPLHNLIPHHHYAVWNLNAKDEGERTGEWFWTDFVELLPTQAAEVIAFKRRHHDVDFPHPKGKIQLVAELGYPEGNQIYDLASQLHEDVDSLKRYEWLLVMETYYKDQDTKKAREFKEQLAKERLMKSLFGEEV